MAVFQSRVGGCILLFMGCGLLSLVYKVSTKVVCVEVSLWECAAASMDLSIIFDVSSLLFLSVVCFISGSVLIYCEWYMMDEVFKSRFLGLVLWFVGSMGCLILIPNFFTLLIGWDGLGLTSFLLVIFYQSRSSLGAGMITAITNRIGDVLILCCIGYLAKEGSWMLYSSGYLYNYYWVVWACVVAAMTKSAQMPFSAWLPAAMAAPTPVSSLVHSSTLVTAGVYLLYRAYGGLLAGSSALFGLSYISLVTLIIAGAAALVEIDFKKVVALSTLSQLSMMMFSLSIGLPIVAFFHLVSHAMFKALLFLCVGVVIHENKSYQDIRSLGYGWSRYPASMSCMVVAMVSLCGVPFMSGFYSKDCIVEGGLMCNQSIVFYMMLMMGLITTFYYSMRMAYSALCGVNKSAVSVVKGGEQIAVKVSYMSLFMGAVFIGYFLVEVMESFSIAWEASVNDKMMILSMVLIGYWSYYMVMIVGGGGQAENFFSFFLSSMGHSKYISGNVFSMVGMMLSDCSIRIMDKGWLEKIGPQGASEILGSSLARYNQHVQSGQYFQVILSCIGVGFSFLFLLTFVN